MAILYQYQCSECNQISDQYFNMSDRPASIQCPGCKAVAVKIISVPGVSSLSESPEWVRTVLDVVEKGSNKPHCQEFLKNPTRENYKNWMKKEGIRHLEPGEKPGRPAPTPDTHVITEKLLRKRMERKRIEI